MEEFYGIDLGTTNSCIAIIDEEDSVVVVTNFEGQLTTPSVVAFDEKGDIFVGTAAKANLNNDPERTVSFIKREMSNDNYQRQINGKNITPVEISSLILKKLVSDANQKRMDEEGKEPINRVVITVPAYFGNAERERTTKAGELAGLEVISLINEPTAAALSFGKKNKQNRNILVYDLGGGTFDVSIMKIQTGIMDTLATDGNHHLGGIDWDTAIVDYALMKEGFSVTSKDLNPQELWTLMLGAEDAKKILTQKDSTTIRFAYKGIHNVEITRKEFEELTAGLMEQTMTLVDQAMQRSGLSTLDDILLVGGSSRMPMVKTAIEKKFGISPRVFEPDLAVAKGAALFAAQEVKGYTENAIQMGVDKGSTSIGMASYINDVQMISNLIKISDNQEVSHTFDSFYTRNEGQSSVELAIYEGRSNDDCCDLIKGRLLEKHILEWGTPVPAGTPIKVIVNRGKDGIVKIKAGAVGHEVNFEITTKGVNS